MNKDKKITVLLNGKIHSSVDCVNCRSQKKCDNGLNCAVQKYIMQRRENFGVKIQYPNTDSIRILVDATPAQTLFEQQRAFTLCERATRLHTYRGAMKRGK